MSSPSRPRRDDDRDDTKRCPSCSRSFTRQGRQTYCTAACRQKAYAGATSPARSEQRPPPRPRGTDAT